MMRFKMQKKKPWEGKRRHLYRMLWHFLAKRLGIKEGDKIPRWLSWCMFPIQNLLRKFSKVRVDFDILAYWIDGVWIPIQLIDELRTRKGVYKYKQEDDGSVWLKVGGPD